MMRDLQGKTTVYFLLEKKWKRLLEKNYLDYRSICCWLFRSELSFQKKKKKKGQNVGGLLLLSDHKLQCG